MSEFEMLPVVSSNVESIGHDEATEILRVQFLNGTVYDYMNVTLIEFEQLRAAPSVGSYLNRNIKGTHPYERVG